MKTKSFVPQIAALVITLTAQAETYTWDTSADPGIQTGNGNWATAPTNWTLDGGDTRVQWPNTGSESANFAGNALAADITVSINSPDIQVDDITGHFNGRFCFLNQLSNTSTVRTLTLTGGTYDGTGTTGSQFTINSGNLSITGAVGTTQFKLTGDSDIVKLGNGGLFINSINHDFTGDIHILAGNFFVNSGNNSSLGDPDNDIIINGGTLNHQSNSIAIGATRTVTLGTNGGRIGGNNAALNLTIQGPVTGPGSLEKVSAGTVTLEAASDYAGTTTISAGVLRLGTAGTIPAASNLTINGSGNFNVRNTSGWVHSGTITGDGTGSINLNTGTDATLAGDISGVAVINANNADTNATISGNISGSTNITVQNSGGNVLHLTGNNSHTGTTTIQNGSLEFNSIADFGSTSALGAPVSGDIQIGSGNNFATFRYIGAGHSSNRTVRLGDATPANTGVGAIQNHGSGALVFTAPNFNTPVSGITVPRTVWLGGQYTGAPNEIQGIIQDNDTDAGGVVNVGKANDATTWLLSGANTYTGHTTVQAGTLKLAATGSIAGSTSLNLNAGGTLDTTAHSTYAIPATQLVTFGLNATDSGSIDAAGLDITQAGVTFSGTPGAPVHVLATYTGLTGAAFANVTNLPTGYTLDYAYEGNKIALVESAVTGFAAWQAANSTSGGLDEDHDGDGVSNGIEYFLGGASDTTGFTALPGVDNDGGTLSVTWTKAADYAGVYGTDFRVETSTTLEALSWTTETPGVNVTITGNTVKYTFPAGTKNFVRLNVTGP